MTYLSKAISLTLTFPSATRLRMWVRYLRALWVGWRNRRIVDELIAMDAKMLRDMGLQRGELDWATDGSSDVEGWARLKSLSDERRGITHHLTHEKLSF